MHAFIYVYVCMFVCLSTLNSYKTLVYFSVNSNLNWCKFYTLLHSCIILKYINRTSHDVDFLKNVVVIKLIIVFNLDILNIYLNFKKNL